MLGALVLMAYAFLLFAGGVYAYVAAPAEANATTAVIVPGACAAVMMLLGLGVAALKRGRGAQALHIVALVLMLVFAGAFSMRAMGAGDDVRAFLNARTRLEQSIEAGQVADTPEARERFFEQQGTPDHDKSYLANTLWGLVLLSALGFIVGVVAHPPGRD